jgi:peptidoglycan/xylan/chitin deacetylase (PgdA/CDA1 family)
LFARPPRRTLLHGFPLAIAITVLAPAPASASVLHDRLDAAGPLDIVKASVSQSVGGMTIRARVRGPIDRGALDPTPAGGDPTPHFLCIDMKRRGRGRVQRLCPAGQPGRLGVETFGAAGRLRSQRTIRTRTFQASQHVLHVGFSPQRAGVSRGRYRVHATSDWSGPACASSCRDRAPNGRTIGFHVRPVRVAGCDDSGIGAVRNGSRAHKRIALTFDDGPSAYTAQVISILSRYHAYGTFFEVGQEVAGRAAVMKSALAHGDELGDHSMHHSVLPSRADIAHTARVIERASGFRPCLFRPPYGAYNSAEVRRARAEGMSTILWDVDPADWSRPGASAIYARVVSNARPGSIVIMHDGGGDRSQTVAALPAIIRKLKSRHYRLVTVSDLLGQPLRYRLG